jgi:hypothetical protein
MFTHQRGSNAKLNAVADRGGSLLTRVQAPDVALKPRLTALLPPLKIALVCVAVLVAVLILHRPADRTVVIGEYYGAGFDLRQGHSPYGEALAWAAKYSPTDPINMYTNVYNIPPLLAFLFAPLTHFSTSVVASAWEVLAVFCALYLADTMTRIIAPKVRGGDRVVVTAVVFAVILLFGPLRRSMADTESDVQLLAVLAAAISALRAGRSGLSGLLLGLAIAIKPTYIFIIALYLWRRDWRAAVSAVSIGAAAIVVPFLMAPHGTLTDYLNVTATTNVPGVLMSPRSISVFGVLARVCYLLPSLWHLLNAPHVAQAVQVVIGLAILGVATRLAPRNRPLGDEQWNYTWGLAVLVMLLGSPLTENTHLVLAAIPLAMVVAQGITLLWQDWRRAGQLLSLGALFYLSVTLPVQQFATFSTYTGWHIVLAFYWFCTLAGLSALTIWAGLQISNHPVEGA